MDNFMAVQFDILSYMGNLYGFDDKTLALNNHFSNRDMGCNTGDRYSVAPTGFFITN